MGYITDKSADTYRDNVVAGVPASGPHDPEKSDIRSLFAFLDGALAQLLAAFVADQAVVVYASRSSLYGDLSPGAPALGIVYNDGSNNGLYIKSGAGGSGSWNATGLMLQGQKGDDGPAGKSFLQTAIDTGYVPAGTTEAQLNDKIVGQITAQAVAARDAAIGARTGSETARSGAETARDTAKGWAEGPVPTGGERSSKGWALLAGDKAAAAGTYYSGIQQLVGQVPSNPVLQLQAATRDILRGFTSMNDGAQAFLAESGREGVFVWRVGDYSTQIAADPYEALYVKASAVVATQGAWCRIVADRVFRYKWTGITADTADVTPMIRSANALFPSNTIWQLEGHDHVSNPPGNADPTLGFDKPGVTIRGSGRVTRFNYLGTRQAFDGQGLLRLGASNITIEDVFGSLIAPNNSAANPAFVAVAPNQAAIDAAASLPDLENITIRRVGYDRTSTGILLTAYRKTNGTTFKRARNITLDGTYGKTNGAAVSIFGAERVVIRDFDYEFDASLPSNSPAAKTCGFRILGAVDVFVGDGTIRDYPEGFYLDAAYFGARAKNKNVTVGRVDMPGVHKPILVVECDGTFHCHGPITASLPITDTTDGNAASAVRILANLPLSTIPADAPESDKYSTVGDVVIQNVEAIGYPIGVFHQGTSGKLTLERNVVVGNSNTSAQTFLRGAVLCSGIGGKPSAVIVNDNDFRQTVAAGLPSLLLDATSGLIEARRNLLPERADPENSIIVPTGNVLYTDAVEQRPFNLLVNLGTNRQHPIGTFANYQSGTAMPAALPTPAAWTRDITAATVTENPTGTFTKTGAAAAFDGRVSSVQSYVGDFELVWRMKNIVSVDGAVAVGIDVDANTPAYGSIDWSVMYGPGGTGFGNARPYNGGTALGSGSKAYGVDTVERWRRVGTRLIFSRGGVDLFETTVSPDIAFKLQITFARQNDSVEILRFGAI